MKIVSIESQGGAFAQMGDEITDTIDSILLVGEAESISELEHESDQLVDDMRLLGEIRDSIKQHGITPSLESMFGESLQEAGVRLSDAEVACEGIVDTAKEVLRKIWRFILTVVAKIKDFFAKRFGAFQKYAKALKQRLKSLEQQDANKRRIVAFQNKKGEDNTISRATIPSLNLFVLVADDVKVIKLIQEAVKSCEYATNIDDIEGELEGLIRIEVETDDDGYATIKVEDLLDDSLETDRKVTDVVANDAVYISACKSLHSLAKEFGAGKLYSSLQKTWNKVDAKAHKNAKASDFDDDSKVEAANVRAALNASNKVIKIVLRAASECMATALAIPMVRANVRNANGGNGGQN